MDTEKQLFLSRTAAQLQAAGFRIEREDATRPWGGFFVIDETQAQQFADTYFDGLPIEQLKISGKLSPKILLVAPQQRLSWQYHLRRGEIWRVVQGPVGVAPSETDEAPGAALRNRPAVNPAKRRAASPDRAGGMGHPGRNMAAYRHRSPLR